jgi:hypothetical protein
MGLVASEIAFDGRAPTAARVAEKVTELVGLPVLVNEDWPAGVDELYDLHAELAFARYPDIKVELYAYRPGAVAEFIARMDVNEVPFNRLMQGANEPPGTQVVYLRWFAGPDLTLFVATTIALEDLGGRAREPVTPEMRRNYAHPIAEAELDRRHRRARRKRFLALLATVALLPILVPFWLASAIWYLLTLPWRISRACKLYRQHIAHSAADQATS